VYLGVCFGTSRYSEEMVFCVCVCVCVCVFGSVNLFTSRAMDVILLCS
jgi:hypothetical protein